MKKAKLILIIVLAALLLVYIVLKLSNPSERTRPVFRINPQRLVHIEIFNSEQDVKLVKEDGIWKTANPVLWPADSLKVHNFLEDVIKAGYSPTPMSQSESAIKRYELEDNQALHIRVSDGSREIHALFSNLGNPWDYFRYADEQDVYQIQSKVVQKYQPDIVNWRSAELIHYWEDELRQIKVEHESNTYTLDRLGTEWYYRDAKNDFEVDFDNFSLVKIVNILQNFRSYIFASGEDEEYRTAFENPMCTVWITDTAGDTRKLEFVSFDDHRHLLRIDEDNSVLFQVGFDTVFRFTRNPEIFKRRTSL